MSFNLPPLLLSQFWTHFISGACASFITILAHFIAMYLVKGTFGITRTFKSLIFYGITYFFTLFFSNITPCLSIEQTCAYTLFYFTLAITIITDYYTYLISTLVTLYLLPAVFFYAHKGYLNITLSQSILSALIVGCSMYLINFLYERRRGTPAFGDGDKDLLIYIAAFLGWFSTLIIIFYASLIGSVWGIFNLMKKRETSFGSHMLPFGTCLGFGTFAHILISFFHGPLF